MILGIVAGSIAFLVIVGVIIGIVSNNNGSAGPTAPITPDSGTPTAHAPQPQPGQPSDEPSDEPTKSQPTSGSTTSGGGGTTSGPISFGGCSLTPAAGWTKHSVKASKGVASVTNSDGDIFQAQCLQQDAGTDPKDVLSKWFDQIAEDCTDSDKQPAETIDTGSTSLTAAQAQMTCSVSDSQGSYDEGIASAVAVRKDGMTAVTTIIYTSSSDTNQISQDYSDMTLTVWKSLEK